MSLISISLKWGKQTFPNIDIDLNESPETLKTQFYTLTNVLPKSQKIFIKKGIILKDDAKLTSFNLSSGAIVTMMGSAEIDEGSMPSSSLASMDTSMSGAVTQSSSTSLMNLHNANNILVTPIGFENHQNTCYMNATLQCLRVVPPLIDAILTSGGRSSPMNSTISSAHYNILYELKTLIMSMNITKSDAILPAQFLTAFRICYPTFNEQRSDGVHAQQDADEAWTNLLSTLALTLPNTSTGVATSGTTVGSNGSMIGGRPPNPSPSIIPIEQQPHVMESSIVHHPSSTTFNNVIDELFGIYTSESLSCDDLTGDPAAQQASIQHQSNILIRKLVCHINKDTKTLQDGLLGNLVERQIQKNCLALNNALCSWTKTTTITRLPPFLTCHLMRFFWKPVEKLKAKILKSIFVPTTLDVVDLLGADLKQRIINRRHYFNKKRDEERESQMSGSASVSGVITMDVDTTTFQTPNHNHLKKKRKLVYTNNNIITATTMISSSSMDASAIPQESSANVDDSSFLTVDDEEGCVLGYYDIVAVLAHKGLSSDSGHYIAWVKDNSQESGIGGTDKSGNASTTVKKAITLSSWYKFDDDKVSMVDESDVKKLYGGGDFPMAYIVLYQARNTLI